MVVADDDVGLALLVVVMVAGRSGVGGGIGAPPEAAVAT